MRTTIIIVLAILLTRIAYANTEAPSGLGRAGTWVQPCTMLEKQVDTGRLLGGENGRQAALCEGAFSGIMAVNYIDPPYLPFCEADDATMMDYVRAFLAFMRSNPQFATKQFGVAVIVALGRAYPASRCQH